MERRPQNIIDAKNALNVLRRNIRMIPIKHYVGLSCINIELTSNCNKNCWMCGRRKLEKEHPELCSWGDMNFRLVAKLAREIPRGMMIQFHNNGEPLCYPLLLEALQIFNGKIRCLNTNGKLLVHKAYELIDNLESLTISVIENDPEGDEQYEIVKKFLLLKGKRKPANIVYRLLGNVEKKERWYELPGRVATRVLHDPMGSFDYQRKVTIPEHGICLDLLNHIAINKDGLVSVCVRFDPEKQLVIGDCNNMPLWKIWNIKKRTDMVKAHLQGRRNELSMCSKCHFYGCPTANE